MFHVYGTLVELDVAGELQPSENRQDPELLWTMLAQTAAGQP